MRITQRKGDTAVAQAIATFTKLGYDVSIPLTESASYDLIVDSEGSLHRVQVKFSKNPDVGLRRIHSNSSGYVVKRAKENSYDWLVVLHKNELWIHKGCPFGRNAIRVNETNFEKLE